MHNGFVRVDNEKMSKSLGNFFTIREILARYDAETVRFFIIRAHYRSPLNYSDAHLDDAKASLKRLYTALKSVDAVKVDIDWRNPYAARFKVAMDEDFGTPEAMAVLFDLASEVNKNRSVEMASLLGALGATLGLLQNDRWLQGGVPNGVGHGKTITTTLEGQVEPSIDELIAARTVAKQAKDFAEADRIRSELLAQGIVLKDSSSGTTWEAAS